MTKKIMFSIILAIFCFSLAAQTVQKGPYTLSTISNGVYHIIDANDSNPAGVQYDEDGNSTGMNNCSDMYLIVGSDKALLIDLSNNVQWDNTAAESLRSIVYEHISGRQLMVSLTHRHGDHLGMLHAFTEDPGAEFLIPYAEFAGMDIFPAERTSYFSENESLDLGGEVILNTLEVPGHTDHSTLFFLKGKNIVFSGDAIGSGSGVWLFNNESFYKYIDGIEHLINYIENPENSIDAGELEIHGGHSWQKGNMEKLTVQYIYDMKTLIERMGLGKAETQPASASFSFLDTNFKYGTATITWNKESAEKYAAGFGTGLK